MNELAFRVYIHVFIHNVTYLYIKLLTICMLHE